MNFSHIENCRIIRKICKKLCFTLYEAVDEMNEKGAFLKVLDEKFSSDRMCVNQFLKGARLQSSLDYEGICKVYRYGKVHGLNIIVSERTDSIPLGLFIHEELPIDFDRVVEIISKIAKSLRFAHLRGLVHGILNPGSIFIQDNGGIKIDDFCYHWLTPYLSEIEGAEATYLSYHIAPECYQKMVTIDGRADIYSLGVILLQFFIDYIPFNGEKKTTSKNRRFPISEFQLEKVLSDYPEALQKIITKSLNLNPDQRYWNLRDFIEDLKLLKDEYIVHATPPIKRL